MSQRSWDAVIVGGGHNGLVAAYYLATAGLRTVVLERREIVGGCCVTEEFAPGFHASTGAYVLSMLREPVWRDLRLVERGIVVDPAGPALNLLRRRLAPSPRRRPRRNPARGRPLLRRRREGAAGVRGRAGPDRGPDHAVDRHHSPGPGVDPSPRPRPACRPRPARGPQPPPRLRRPLHVRHLGDPVPVRALRLRAAAGGPRLARDQRLDLRAVDAGNRLRPAPRPRLRAVRRRDPPVGLRARRHGPADRGDGRGRARCRGRDQDRLAGTRDPGRVRPSDRRRARGRRGDPQRRRALQRRPEDNPARSGRARGRCRSGSPPRCGPIAARGRA